MPRVLRVTLSDRHSTLTDYLDVMSEEVWRLTTWHDLWRRGAWTQADADYWRRRHHNTPLGDKATALHGACRCHHHAPCNRCSYIQDHDPTGVEA